MSLINTQSEIDSAVNRMLVDAGIGAKESSLSGKLEANGLGTSECIEHLADIARNGDGKDAIRLRAIETGLKLNGVLREADKSTVSSFTIVINNHSEVNPILIPRII